MNSFSDFDGKIICIDGAQGLKTVKLIILVFSTFLIVKDLEKHETIMKFRRPYGVTHKRISVILSDSHKKVKVGIWKIRFFKNRFSGSLPRTTEGQRVCIEYRVVGLNAGGLGPP